MNPALNPDQSNTKAGGIEAVAEEDLFRSALVVLDDDSGALSARYPTDRAELALFVADESVASDATVPLSPLAPGENARAHLVGTCDAGEILVLCDPTASSGANAGKVEKLPATAGTYFSPGVAEEAGVAGQLVLFRPCPRLVTVAAAFTGATPADTAATNSTPYGYSQAQANALVANVREMRAALIAAGIMAPNA